MKKNIIQLLKKILDLKSIISLIMFLIILVVTSVYLVYTTEAKRNKKIINALLEEKNRILNEEIYSRIDAVIFINKIRNIENPYSEYFNNYDTYELFIKEYENANNSDKLKIIEYTIEKIKE